MVRVRMIKPDDIFSPLAALSLDVNQLARIDVVPVPRRIIPRISAGRYRRDQPCPIINSSQQNSATFMRIGVLAMTAQSIILLFADPQHKHQRAAGKRRRKPELNES